LKTARMDYRICAGLFSKQVNGYIKNTEGCESFDYHGCFVFYTIVSYEVWLSKVP
jgi:hypothetical protein